MAFLCGSTPLYWASIMQQGVRRPQPWGQVVKFHLPAVYLKFRESGNENLMNSLESLAGWLPHQSSINRQIERFKKAALIG